MRKTVGVNAGTKFEVALCDLFPRHQSQRPEVRHRRAPSNEEMASERLHEWARIKMIFRRWPDYAREARIYLQ